MAAESAVAVGGPLLGLRRPTDVRLGRLPELWVAPFIPPPGTAINLGDLCVGKPHEVRNDSRRVVRLISSDVIRYKKGERRASV